MLSWAYESGGRLFPLAAAFATAAGATVLGEGLSLAARRLQAPGHLSCPPAAGGSARLSAYDFLNLRLSMAIQILRFTLLQGSRAIAGLVR